MFCGVLEKLGYMATLQLALLVSLSYVFFIIRLLFQKEILYIFCTFAYNFIYTYKHI